MVKLSGAHRNWLAARAAQVNYAARIVWQELRTLRGFTGSYVIVRRAVAPLRASATVASLTQRRFETAPVEQDQCDWGQITVTLGGISTRRLRFFLLYIARCLSLATGMIHKPISRSYWPDGSKRSCRCGNDEREAVRIG